jgi:hypothetical protein
MNQEPVRILHLIEHLVIGGAERVLVDIVTNIDKDKFKSIVCVYRNENPLLDELVKAGYPVRYLRKNLLTPLFPKFLKPLLLFIESIIFVIRLAKLMRDKDIQILHTHLFSAGLWGRLAALFGGRPKIITTEHTTTDWEKSLKKTVSDRLLNTPWRVRQLIHFAIPVQRSSRGGSESFSRRISSTTILSIIC